ncbi:hypothetical protein CYK37_30025 [Mesorhizobium loti]|nr:hypothetical protein [Mesorhizobium loti]PLP55530.1 hypothetical protein CYK37_30025 [Mesorhizobium loti]
MNQAIRLIHCFGAILTGIVIVVLAVGINATHGDAFGAAQGFISLIAGYFVGVITTGATQVGKGTLCLAFTSWSAAAVSVVCAIINLI